MSMPGFTAESAMDHSRLTYRRRSAVLGSLATVVVPQGSCYDDCMATCDSNWYGWCKYRVPGPLPASTACIQPPATSSLSVKPNFCSRRSGNPTGGERDDTAKAAHASPKSNTRPRSWASASYPNRSMCADIKDLAGKMPIP